MSAIRGQDQQIKQSGKDKAKSGCITMMCETCCYWDYGDCDKTGYYMAPDDWCWRWKENCRDYLTRN